MTASPTHCRRCGAPEPQAAGLCVQCAAAGAGPAPEHISSGRDDDASTVIAGDPSPLHPETIGPYRILSLLGEGGMGAVYLAEQQTPRRRVAVKVVKAGMDTREVVARFEAERQTLAMMDHPSIATVFDAGVTAAGRPYFAMEYVAGIPITDYCDRHQLSTTARLELFLQVCGAIQHAHQKGVIHRDVKPSNVLVSVGERGPVPKVIDFGLAKATNQRLTEKTLFTQLGVLVGTPEYMSPEQAEMTGLDVDTTTDIYSLGVLLYELLAGALPFDSARLRRGGYAEIQRIIREEEPAKPSTRLSSLGADAAAVARRRGTDLMSLARQLRGDLDWITLKAMEKDRTRRYASASELAADVRRHLSDEPVVARRTGVAYRTWKFARRHRAGVAVAATIGLVMVASAVMLAIQARRIAVERDLAVSERKRAEAVSEFLVSLFQASDPNRSKGQDVSARQLLEEGRKRIAVELKDQPGTRATLLHAMGRVFSALDLNDAAESLLTEALALRKDASGRDRAALADTLSDLAHVHTKLNAPARAEPLFQESLRLRRDIYGPEHLDVARAIANLGITAYYRGEYAQSEAYALEAAAMAERVGAPRDAVRIRANAANDMLERGRVREAIDIYRVAIAAMKETDGLENTRTQQAMSNFSAILNRAGEHEEAERTQREVLQVRRKLLGPAHFDVAVSLYNLAGAVAGQGRHEEAERLYEESLAIHETGRRPADAQHGWVLTELASTRRQLGKFAASERAYHDAIDMFGKAGNTKPGTAAFAWDGLGTLHYAQRGLAEAERSFRRALDIRRAAGEQPGHGLAQSLELLAQTVCERGNAVEGERLAREAREIRMTGDPASPALAFTNAVLGRCLTARGRYDEAETLLTSAYDRLAAQARPALDSLKYAAESAVILFEKSGRPELAASWRRKPETAIR